MGISTGYAIDKLYVPKVTRILEMWAQPCNVNPIIWVTAYLAASPTLAVAFLEPDCLDLAYDRFRLGHKPKRKGHQNINALLSPIGIPKKGLNTVAFALGALAQRVGFFLTLIDATQDWVIHGTSLAYQWNGCNDPNVGHATLTMSGVYPFLFFPQENPIGTWHVEPGGTLSAGPGGVAVPNLYAAGAGFSLSQIKNTIPGLPDASWSARLRDYNADWRGPWIDPGAYQGDIRTATFSRSTLPPQTRPGVFRVEVRKGAGVLCMSGVFNVSGAYGTGIGKSACGHSLGKPVIV